MDDSTVKVEDRLRALTEALLSVDQALSRAVQHPEVDLTEEIASLRDAAVSIRTAAAEILDCQIRQRAHQLSADLSALIARAVIERGGGGAVRMNLRLGHLRHVARCARRGHRWQEHAKEAGDVLVDRPRLRPVWPARVLRGVSRAPASPRDR